jgi:hypothetical protein
MGMDCLRLARCLPAQKDPVRDTDVNGTGAIAILRPPDQNAVFYLFCGNRRVVYHIHHIVLKYQVSPVILNLWFVFGLVTN